MCCHNKYTPDYFDKYHTLISKRCKGDDDVPLQRRRRALMAAAVVDVPARARSNSDAEAEQEQERRRGLDGQKKAFKDKGLVADTAQDTADTAQGPGRVDDAPPGTGAEASNSDADAPQHLLACPICGKDFSRAHPNARQVCECVCICVCWRLLARCWMLVCLMPCRRMAPYAVDTSHLKKKLIQ